MPECAYKDIWPDGTGGWLSVFSVSRSAVVAERMAGLGGLPDQVSHEEGTRSIGCDARGCFGAMKVVRTLGSGAGGGGAADAFLDFGRQAVLVNSLRRGLADVEESLSLWDM